MRRSLLALLLLAGLISGWAGPASALHGLTGKDFVPNTPEIRVYFKCEGATRLHSVLTDEAIPWSTTAPTQSIQAGGGCASFDNALHGSNQTSVQDSHFEGTYGGNIDKITVTASNISLGPGRQNGRLTVNVRLAVDGVPLLGATGKDVTVQTVPSSFGAERIAFTIVGINLMKEADDIQHDVLLTLSGGAFAANAIVISSRDTQNLWVYDASDAASGLIFNPTTVEATTIAR